VTLDSMPPEVEEELAPIRKAVDGLRAAAANYNRPEVLAPSHPAVLAVAKAHDQVMQELTILGFNSLGSTGDRLRDGNLGVSRWFVDSGSTICGWLAFLNTRNGPLLIVFLATEASGPAYCITKRGGTRLSLATPPNVDRSDADDSASLADMVRKHRERVNALVASGEKLRNVGTIGDAIDIIARLNQNRADWRASSDEDELLRADLISVLSDQARKLSAEDFSLLYGQAAEWLDYHPTHSDFGDSAALAPLALGDFVARAPTPLADVLSESLTSPRAEEGAAGIESDWLFHCELELQGHRLQMLDVFMAGNDGEGVILDASPGVYVVETRVITYGIDRRISRVRVYPKSRAVTQGQLAGEVGVDLAAVAICDVDRLAGWAMKNEDEWQRWGQKLWFDRTARAGLYTCEPANTVLAFVESGFGDGTYPIHYLLHDGRPVGLEAEFISPETPYL
jgi:hypothetical protein